MPDLDMISFGVATVLFCTLNKSPDAESMCPPESRAAMELFNQDTYLTEGAPPGPPVVPDIPTIFTYIKNIFLVAEFTPECNVLSLVYVNRLLAFTKMPLTGKNWRMSVLSALLLAQKVWDDRCLANVDFPVIWVRLSLFCWPHVNGPPHIACDACAPQKLVVPDEAHRTSFDLKAINNMERRFLELLGYNVTVSAGLYARYYFELRALAQENKKDVGLKALDKQQARNLELVSASCSERLAGGESVLKPRSMTYEDATVAKSKGKHVISNSG